MTRKPGRPKHVRLPPTVHNHGVVEHPDDEQNVTEFLYQTPSVIRKLINMLKTYYVHVITFDFTIDSLIITASDHTSRVPIIVSFNCNDVLRYYCRQPFKISMNRVYLDKIASTITYDYNTVSLTSNAQNYHSTLQILFSSNEIYDQYDID
jgi:hypothetical protein